MISFTVTNKVFATYDAAIASLQDQIDHLLGKFNPTMDPLLGEWFGITLNP